MCITRIETFTLRSPILPTLPNNNNNNNNNKSSKVYYFVDEGRNLSDETQMIQHIEQNLVYLQISSIKFEKNGRVLLTMNADTRDWGCPCYALEIRDRVAKANRSGKLSDDADDDHDGLVRDSWKRLIKIIVTVPNLAKFPLKKFPDFIATDLGKALAKCQHLKTLKIIGDNGTRGKMNVICRLLRNSSCLEELDLTKFHLHSNKDTVISFAKGLRKNKNLRTLNLEGCSLSDAPGAVIIRALLNHPSIQNINLNRNNCGSTTLMELAALLRMPHCSLQTLKVKNFREASGCVQLDFTPITNALRINTSLKQIEIPEELTSSSLMNFIKSLGVSSLMASEQTTSELGDTMMFCAKVSVAKEYFVKNNHIRKLQEKGFALTSLNLSGIVIEPKTLSILSDVLANGNGGGATIENLDMNHCGITEEGILSFTHRFPEMEGLKTLYVNVNPFIGASGLKSLLDALRYNMSLINIEMFDILHLDVGMCGPPRSYGSHSDADAVKPFLPEINFYLSLNKLGRKKLLRDHANNDVSPPQDLLALVLENALRDKEMGVGMVYYFVRNFLPTLGGNM